jgi:hypothetical protein
MSRFLSVLAVIGSVSVVACAGHDAPSETVRVRVKPHEVQQSFAATIRRATRDNLVCPPAAALENATRQQCVLEAERLGKFATLWCAGL